MPEEITIAENTVREEPAAPVRANFELLSDDKYLNDNINNVVEEKPTEAVEAPKDVVEEIVIEAEKPIEEEKPTEVVEEPLTVEAPELEELVIDANNDESAEGSWAYVAKLDGLTLKDDTLDAYKEALVAPYEEKLKAVESLTKEKVLANYDPKIRMIMELADAGMSYEDIIAPNTRVNEFKSMSQIDLVRKNIELTHTDWTPEMVDTEMEILSSVDGRLEHEHKKIILDLDKIEAENLAYRNELINKHKINSETNVLAKQKESVESVSKALNNMSKFMGFDLPEKARADMSSKMNNGSYDQLFNDPIAKAEFIAWKELGSKILKNSEAKSYAKGREEITKKLHNIPPIVSGGAGKPITSNVEGNFEKLKDDTYLNG